MIDPPGPPTHRGTDARDALAEVLRDQSTRQEKRRAQSPSRNGRRGAGAIAGLAAVAAWLWIAPPAAVVPETPPPPPPAAVEAGLRMDMWMVAVSIEEARVRDGVLPATVDGLLEEPEDGSGVRYLPSGRSFTLVGERDGVVVRWSSDEGVAALTAPVPLGLSARGGS